MKYLSTIEILNDLFDNLQDELNCNAFKYVKGKKINEALITKYINEKINKSIKEPWIDENELLGLIDNDKIKIDIIKDSKNNILKYTLTNKKGKKIFISSKITKISYYFIENNVRVNIILPIDGDILDFGYLFQNKNILSYTLDITGMKTMMTLLIGQNIISNKEYHYGW